MGWLENDEYDAALRDSRERAQDFYKKVSMVNVTYVTTTGEVGEMDISPEEYRLFSEKTYDPKNTGAYEAAKAALEERKQEHGIVPLPAEFYAVSQTVNRKFQVEALCADGRVAAVKSGMASISEAKKALMEIFKERKGTARVEFIHPQVLWDKSRPLHWEDHEHAPDVDYMIKMAKGTDPTHTHYDKEHRRQSACQGYRERYDNRQRHIQDVCGYLRRDQSDNVLEIRGNKTVVYLDIDFRINDRARQNNAHSQEHRQQIQVLVEGCQRR